MENNKKTTIFIMLVIAFIVISTGCNKYEETENVPTLQLEYQEDEKIETMTIRHGTATWRYKERGLDADSFASSSSDSDYELGDLEELQIENYYVKIAKDDLLVNHSDILKKVDNYLNKLSSKLVVTMKSGDKVTLQ